MNRAHRQTEVAGALAAKVHWESQPKIHFLIVDVKQASAITTRSMNVIAMFHQLSEGAPQKMLHTPGVTTSNKWPSGSRK